MQVAKMAQEWTDKDVPMITKCSYSRYAGKDISRTYSNEDKYEST